MSWGVGETYTPEEILFISDLQESIEDTSKSKTLTRGEIQTPTQKLALRVVIEAIKDLTGQTPQSYKPEPNTARALFDDTVAITFWLQTSGIEDAEYIISILRGINQSQGG